MTRAADADPGQGEARLFAADEEVGRDLSRGRLGRHPARAAGVVAAEPADGGRHPADLALLDVDGLGAGADVLLQRRLPPRHARPQVPVGARPACQRGVGGDLGRHRPADRHRDGHWRGDLGRGAAAVPGRSGFPEETYHTFSYSPLPDDAAPSSACSAWSARTPSGHRRAADGDPARPGLGPERGPHRAGDARLRRTAARPQPA